MKCVKANERVQDSLISKLDTCYLKVTPTLALRSDDRRKQTDTDVHTKTTESGNPSLRSGDLLDIKQSKEIVGFGGSDRQGGASGLIPSMLECPLVEQTAPDEQVFASAAICVWICVCLPG